MIKPAPHLHAVGPDEPAPEAPATESGPAHMKRLRAELATLVDAELADFMAALDDLTMRAAAIGSGDLHKPGIRDLAARLAEHCAAKGQTLQAISGRKP